MNKDHVEQSSRWSQRELDRALNSPPRAERYGDQVGKISFIVLERTVGGSIDISLRFDKQSITFVLKTNEDDTKLSRGFGQPQPSKARVVFYRN